MEDASREVEQSHLKFTIKIISNYKIYKGDLHDYLHRLYQLKIVNIITSSVNLTNYYNKNKK